MNKKRFLIIALMVGLLVYPALAGNIVVNGDFETGPTFLAPWTTGQVGVGGGGDASIQTDNPHSPSHAFRFGAPTCCDTLAQTLTTTAGGSYNLSFWLQADAEANSFSAEFLAYWDGKPTPILDINSFPQGGFAYTQYSVLGLTATTTGTALEFSAYDGGVLYLRLDDVSVTDAVPEASGWILMSAGLLALGGLRRLRKKL